LGAITKLKPIKATTEADAGLQKHKVTKAEFQSSGWSGGQSEIAALFSAASRLRRRGLRAAVK
jgi:hypothetical protein